MNQNRKLSIVVVEDNLIYQQLIARQLEPVSSSIFFYTSGEACISQINDLQPELIVMDYNLEGDMTGLDTLKAVRLLLPDVHVILFTDQRSVATAENAVLYGAFEFVEKNESSIALLAEIVRMTPVFLQKEACG